MHEDEVGSLRTGQRAGPDRVLALVYLRAPGWPSGPGDADLGLDHARRAVEIDPEYPPNRLALAEALRETEPPGAAREAYESAAEASRRLLEQGDVEAADWLDEALEALRADQDFLMKGDVFTQDAIDMWIDYKTENEVNDVKLRPHPHEFYLYYDI